MRLAPKQSLKLLRERGIWITEACDKCGRLLGSVRWTKRGEPGEWCSRECRDGKAESQAHEVRVAHESKLTESLEKHLFVGRQIVDGQPWRRNNLATIREEGFWAGLQISARLVTKRDHGIDLHGASALSNTL